MIDKRAARPGLIARLRANRLVPSITSPCIGWGRSWVPQDGQKAASAETGRWQRGQLSIAKGYPLRREIRRIYACTITEVPESASAAVHLEIGEGVAQIILNRPPLNVLDIETLRRLNRVLAKCDSRSVRAVLIRSGLSRAFSAGVEVRDHHADRLDAMLQQVREQAHLMLTLEAITIAAIHGSTLGGGAELALLCDVVIAADDTRFGFPEIGLAAFPPIAAALLRGRCPWPVAMRLLLGESIDAPAALELGLVAGVVPASGLAEVAQQRARQVAGHSGVALKGLTGATRRARSGELMGRIDGAIETYRALIGSSHDAQEGIDAFLEKRAPAWSHR
jgi:cyclohexa-1,5-dienecarbonyl-CoA hydratase